VATPSAGKPTPALETANATPPTFRQRMGRLWRAPADAVHTGAGYEARVEALETRMEHLEAALEGLQDAVYRHAVLADKRDDELLRRTEPHELARELGRDARKRGV
jgi:uncharacterized coiled-coil protein SlyX